MNSLKATVHMCNEGHSFCQDCLARALPARGQRKCPVCRCPVRNPPAVNYSLQELIRRQVVECSHCKARMTRKERIETNHKAQCPERPVSCTASPCKWKGVQREWADHKAGCLDCKVASAIKPLRATVTELSGHLERLKDRVLALEGGEVRFFAIRSDLPSASCRNKSLAPAADLGLGGWRVQGPAQRRRRARGDRPVLN